MRREILSLVQQVGLRLEQAGRLLGTAAAVAVPLAEFRQQIGAHWAGWGSAEAAVDRGWFGWEQALYPQHVRPQDEVLVVGAGSCRDVIPFLRAGQRVRGIDLAAPAIERGRRALAQRHLAAELEVGELPDEPLDRAYDVIIFSYSAYAYVPTRAGRLEQLRAARQRLLASGRVLISHFDYSEETRPRNRVAQLAAWASGSDWRPEVGDLFLRGVPGVHFEHMFATGELADEAAACGLRVLDERTVEGMRLVVLVRAG